MSETTASSFAAIDRNNPWPGLATFTEDQGAFFHGRDDEIDDLTQLARLRALVVLFGQSGLGKSSLLQAGVFPRLRKSGFCPVYIRLDHAESAPSPTEQIKTLVLAETARVGTWTKPNAAKPGETLWELFHHRDDRLLGSGMGVSPMFEALKQTHGQDARATPEPPISGQFAGLPIIPVLVFDQFEELFTLGAAAGARRDRALAFMGELAELVENRPSEQLVARLEASADELDAFDFGRTDYRVVITLREDFLPDLEGMKTIMPALMTNRMRLARMTGTQALQAVLKPGAGLVIEEVATAIVEFVAGARGGSVERLAELNVEPALLSVVCRELNERRRSLGQAQITADLVTGNRREILTHFYERSVDDLPAGGRAFVEDHLLTKSGFRDNLALETALEFPGVTRPLIDTLVARRLLRLEDRLGVQRVELTHDVLADVIRSARDARQQRLAGHEAARHSRRQRWVIAGLAASVVALLIGAFFGIRAQRRAVEHASRLDLILGSRLLDEGKLADGLAHLVSAARKDPENPVPAPRILTALAAHNFFLPEGAPLALPSPAMGGSYFADGRRILIQCEDDVVRVIDAMEWKLERELDFGQKVRRGATRVADNNGEVFAVVLVDGSMVVCDAATGRPRFASIRPPEKLAARSPIFAFSPDGRWLAAGNATTLWLWDAESGSLRATLPSGNEGPSRRFFAFSPDSRHIVTAVGSRNAQRWTVPEGAPAGEPIQAAVAGAPVVSIFSADGRRLLMWRGNSARVYDTATGTPIGPSLALESWRVSHAMLTNDGSRLVVVEVGRTEVYDMLTAKPVFSNPLHDAGVREAALSRDGNVLFTNSGDGLFHLWDLTTGKPIGNPTFRQPQYAPALLAPGGNAVTLFTASGLAHRLRLGRGSAAPLVLPRDSSAVVFVNMMPSPPARLMWLSRTQSRAIAIDAASGREVEGGFTFPEPLPSGVSGGIRSGYGLTLGSGQSLVFRQVGVLRAWTIGDRKIEHDVVLGNVPARVGGFNLNPTGVLVAFNNGGDGPNSVGIWNLRTGDRVAAFQMQAPLAGMSMSPDEKRIAIRTDDGEERTIHVCEIASGKELFGLQLFGRARMTVFRFSANGARIYAGDDLGSVHVWDAADGRLLRSTQAHRDGVWRFEYSDDGRYYASSSDDGSVQVWGAVNDSPVGKPLAQTGSASRPGFSPDGGRIFTSSSAGTARVWDIRSGHPLTGPLDHGDETVNYAASFPDGRFVTTHSGRAGKSWQRAWSAPPDGRGARTPDWLLRLATICAGQRVTDDGRFVVAAEEFAQIDAVRRELAALPDNAPYVEWGRWLLSDSPERSIAPGFTVTPTEAAKLTAQFAAASADADLMATLTARANLHKEQGNWAEVEKVERQVLELVRARDGAESLERGWSLIALVRTLLKQGKFTEAESLAREALAIREKLFPGGSTQIDGARGWIGQTLVGQKRYAEAEPLLLLGYDRIMEDVRAYGSQVSALRTEELAESLAQLYAATNQPEKAALWKRRAAGLPDTETVNPPAAKSPKVP